MTGLLTERADTGAAAYPSSGELYQRARKVSQLAATVMDCTRSGCTARDVVRASGIMAEIGALAGGDRHD